MSLRDFLLDYAEKAPKAERVKGRKIRFEIERDSLAGVSFTWKACPLELVGREYWKIAAQNLGIPVRTAKDIAIAADRAAPRLRRQRDWRAILEKLAEPEPEREVRG